MNKVDFIFEKFLELKKISTDTRKIEPDSIFFALKGDKFNGNQYAQEALQKGAKYVVIDEADFQINDSCILVDNVLKTLQTLANLYRKTFHIPFIAIGGSNGKTTTKELIASVLSKRYKTFATKGNLNNHIGVPLTLLSIPQDTEMAVIEMGANHIGEYEELCQIAAPNYGIITNIGLDHLEGFGSLEGVAQANSELYYYLFKNKGTVFVNTAEEHLSRMAARFETMITYPQNNDYYQASLQANFPFLKVETEKGELITTNLVGRYNFANIVTALCIGKYFEVPSSLANKAVEEYIPSNNRSQLVSKGSNTIILDAYNANPSSMEQAILSFGEIEAKSKAVILGDMYELGNYSEAEHAKLGELVARQNFDLVIFYGKYIAPALQTNPKAYYFSDKFSLHNWLQDKKIENTHILVKGSRGVGLETVVDFV